MDQRNPAGEFQAGFKGQVSGQVRVGAHLLVIGSPEGASVQPSLPEVEPGPQPRLAPPLPRRPAAFFGREQELSQAAAALQAGGARLVEVYGLPGSGRTTFLRALAYHPSAQGFPDGVVYLNAAGQPREDLLLSLFDAFYETPPGARPDEDGARRALQSCRALILLDDAALNMAEMESLAGAAPGCVFVVASTERQLWGKGSSLALPGLAEGAGLELFELCLGRRLAPEERPAAEAQCSALGGNPLYILQAAAFSRFSDLHAQGSGNPLAWIPSPERLKAQILTSLSTAERPLVYSLAALEAAPMGAAHLATQAAVPEASALLDGLVRRGVVKVTRGRYSLAGDLKDQALNTWDLTKWKFHMASYFADWAEATTSDPALLAEEAEPMLRLAAWAAGTGREGEALRLAHDLEGALALEGRWGSWQQALLTALSAAQSLGGRAAEARALHQLGARALVLGQIREARGYLVRALRLRESLGDRVGQAATRANLDLVLDPVSSTRPVAIPLAQPPRLTRRVVGTRPILPFALLIVTLLLLGGVAGAFWLRSGRPGVPAVARTEEGGSAQGGGAPGAGATLPGRLTFLPIILDPSEGPAVAAATVPSPKAPATSSGLQFPAYTIVPPTPVTPGTTQPPAAVSATPTVTTVPRSGSCGPPAGWVRYTVQANDSIPLVAAVTGVTQEDLMFANCMNGLYWLTPGDVIYVPRLPPAVVDATQTRAAAGTPAANTPTPQLATATPSPTVASQGPATASPTSSGALPTSVVGACLQFADLPLYQVYSYGDSFVTSGVKVTVGGFTNLQGRQTTSGIVEVEKSQAPGEGQDVQTSSASLSFGIPSPANGLSLSFINFGGSVNVEINGDLRNLSSFGGLDGQTVGGVVVRVGRGENEGQGSLDLSGVLRSFHVGGQEMWIEQVCFK